MGVVSHACYALDEVLDEAMSCLKVCVSRMRYGSTAGPHACRQSVCRFAPVSTYVSSVGQDLIR